MMCIDTKVFKRLRQASRWFVLVLLACLAGDFAQAQTLSFSPGQVTAVTATDSTKGSADPAYTGLPSGLLLTNPQGLTFDSQGDLFIVDAGANVVRVVASGKGPIPSLPSVASPVAGTVYTVAGNGSNTPSSTQLCTADQRSTIDSSFYGNGCPATKAILFFLTPNAFNSSCPFCQTEAPIGQVALDGSGNLYIADGGDNQVRVVYGGGSIPPGLTGPLTPGNIYAFTPGAANQNTGNTNSDGSTNLPPIGVAVDASGDVYILSYYTYAADNGMSNLAVVYNGETNASTLPSLLAGQTMTTGQYAPISPLNYPIANWTSAWQDPVSIALDSSGNIYISDAVVGTNSVYVIYAGGTVPGLLGSQQLQGQTPVVGNVYSFVGESNFKTAIGQSSPYMGPNPTQLAFDSAGDLYVGLFGNQFKKQTYDFIAKIDTSANLALVAGNQNSDPKTQIQLVCAGAVDGYGDGCTSDQVGIWGPMGVAVAQDGSGSIYYTDAYVGSNASTYMNALHKIDGSTTSLQFPTQSAGVASAAQVVTISNVDTKTLNISAISIPNNFTQVASGGTDCTASTTLSPGQSCLLSVEFQAVQAGTYSDNVTITSNSTNADSGVNSIAVSGAATPATGTSAQKITFTAPSTATYGQTLTLNGSASSGLALLYQASGPARLQGNTLTVTGVGPITVTAYQPGDNGDAGNSAGWAAATPVLATITAQSEPLTVTANNFDQTPGSPIPTLTYTITGFVNGDTQATATTGVPDLSTTATTTSAPGPYPITITQGTLKANTNNYSLTFVNGTFTIDSRLSQTITFTQNLPTVSYGVAPIALTATASSGLPVVYTVTGPARIDGSTLTITGAGTVGVTATQPGTVTYAPAPNPITQSFLVQPALLTFTASNLTMAVGSPVPTLTYTVSGFVNPDTAATVVSGAPKLATTVTPSSPLGTVAPITITTGSVTLSTNNYTLTSASFVSGTMTVVTGTPQTITFGALSGVTYGVTPFVLNASASSGQPITYTVSSGPASITNNVLAVAGAGTVTVTATQAGNATYNPATPVSQSFNVAQAQLTVTANNITRVDYTANPALTYTVAGLVNGDTATVLSGPPAISTTATPSSPPGTYPIAIGPLDAYGNSISATNYTISNFVPGTLTVTTGGPAQNFTMTLSQPSLTVLAGSTGQVTLTIAPTNYYQGVLNLSCKGLPANASCVFTPAALPVTLNYASSSSTTPIPTTGTLTITTSSAPVVSSLSHSGNGIFSAAITGWTSLLFGIVFASQRKRLARYKTVWMIAMAACLFGMAAGLTACGSSNSFTLTKSGTTTIQVVATDSNGGPVNSTPLAITIQ